MFTNPYLSAELVRERQRDMLAEADQQRLVRQLRTSARMSSSTKGGERRLLRAARRMARLQRQAHA